MTGQSKKCADPASGFSPHEPRNSIGPGPSQAHVYFGIDGCREGWVVVAATADFSRGTCWRATDIGQVFRQLPAKAIAVIDIPIGLPLDSARLCDTEARRFLGRQGVSVFPTPSRAALSGRHYDECCDLNRKALGIGLSRQSHALLEKIREVDRAIEPAMQDRIFESHPEVTFASLSGGPLRHSKKTLAGLIERYRLLLEQGFDLGRVEATDQLEAAPDDLIDACACVVTARRIADGTRRVFGDDETDARGLRMQISV